MAMFESQENLSRKRMDSIERYKILGFWVQVQTNQLSLQGLPACTWQTGRTPEHVRAEVQAGFSGGGLLGEYPYIRRLFGFIWAVMGIQGCMSLTCGKPAT